MAVVFVACILGFVCCFARPFSPVLMSSHLFSTAVLLCWAHVGPLLGTCWLYVGPMLGHLGPMLPMMGLYGRYGECWAMLGLCWAKLGPYWAYVGPSWAKLAILSPSLASHKT